MGNTRKKILMSLLDKDLTALDLVEILEINESAVRRHLDILEQRELVESYFEKADKGRPKKYYRLTEEGRSVFPKEIDIILDHLVDHIIDNYGKEELLNIGEGLADKISENFPEISEDDELKTRIEKIVKGFNDLGFFCDYERKGKNYVIKYKNCVFGELPKKRSDWLCHVHRRLLKDKLKDVKVSQDRSMFKGDRFCRQIIGDNE